MTDEAFQQSAVDSVKKFARRQHAAAKRSARNLRKSLAYVAGDYHQPEAFEKLRNRLEELDRVHKLNGNRLFYLATPPEIYPGHYRATGQGGPGKKSERKILDADHHRKAVRPRPGFGAEN